MLRRISARAIASLVAEAVDRENDVTVVERSVAAVGDIIESLQRELLPVAKSGDLSLGAYGELSKLADAGKRLVRLTSKIQNADARWKAE